MSEAWDAFKLALEQVPGAYTKGTYILSSGSQSTEYYDVRAVCLRRPGIVRAYALELLSEAPQHDGVACIGAGGALLLGLLAPTGVVGYLHNPKAHGKTWSPNEPQKLRLALLDDVSSTGNTLRILRQEVERCENEVVWEGTLFQR